MIWEVDAMGFAVNVVKVVDTALIGFCKWSNWWSASCKLNKKLSNQCILCTVIHPWWSLKMNHLDHWLAVLHVW